MDFIQMWAYVFIECICFEVDFMTFGGDFVKHLAARSRWDKEGKLGWLIAAFFCFLWWIWRDVWFLLNCILFKKWRSGQNSSTEVLDLFFWDFGSQNSVFSSSSLDFWSEIYWDSSRFFFAVFCAISEIYAWSFEKQKSISQFKPLPMWSSVESSFTFKRTDESTSKIIPASKRSIRYWILRTWNRLSPMCLVSWNRYFPSYKITRSGVRPGPRNPGIFRWKPSTCTKTSKVRPSIEGESSTAGSTVVIWGYGSSSLAGFVWPQPTPIPMDYSLQSLQVLVFFCYQRENDVKCIWCT